MNHVTHIGMVDIGDKQPSKRSAKATATVHMNNTAYEKVASGTAEKGNVLENARCAGIMAGKQTYAMIPLCHPIPLDSITIAFELKPNMVAILAEARSTGKTGAEMEALSAVSIAALTIYDMCKMYDKSMTITGIMLLEKQGGKSGHYIRKTDI
ncbi:cyclic pyranopterin monophosphate synthase MoaC [bacterium]|nr:cyclic pyranopterin monophosphate synthase MoaC [bacterium]